MSLEELNELKGYIEVLEKKRKILSGYLEPTSHELVMVNNHLMYLYSKVILGEMDFCDHEMVLISDGGREEYHCLKCGLTNGSHYFPEVLQTYDLSYKWDSLFPDGYNGPIVSSEGVKKLVR